jgi:hypothetical protein
MPKNALTDLATSELFLDGTKPKRKKREKNKF